MTQPKFDFDLHTTVKKIGNLEWNVNLFDYALTSKGFGDMLNGK